MKKVYVLTIASIAVLLIAASVVYISVNKEFIPRLLGTEPAEKKEKTTFANTKLNIVTSLEDPIVDNSVWCGTFNLAWNDLRDNVAKTDIIFTPQLPEVVNLNLGTFTKKELNEKDYYTKFGKKTKKLKEEIENQLKDKWDIESDILNNFTWEEESTDDFIYAILYKEFTFPNKFTKLDNGLFNGNGNYKYFGIIPKTDSKVREQVTVLYYNNENDFAIKVKTNQQDELIFSRGNTESNFLDIYNGIIKKSTGFTGKTSLNSDDEVKIPYIDFKIMKELTNLENKIFKYSDGVEHFIDKAIQSISLSINEAGGKIKSEAAISTKENSAVMDPTEKRYFYMNETFTLFMKAEDKNLPYLALKVSSLDEIQKTDE